VLARVELAIGHHVKLPRASAMTAPWDLVVGRAHLYFGTWRVVVVGSDVFVPVGASSARMSILVETCSWSFRRLQIQKSRSLAELRLRVNSRNRVRVGVVLFTSINPFSCYCDTRSM
jgi:hypothetical protein